MTPARIALMCATALSMASPAAAQTIRSGVDLSAEAEVTSNPYLDQSSNDWIGAATLEVRPWLVALNENDRVELSGFARGRLFSSRFSFEDTLGATLAASSRSGARTQFYGSGSIVTSSARSNAGLYANGLPAGPGGIVPGTGFPSTPGGGDTGPVTPGSPAGPVPLQPPTILPPFQDITLLGLQSRSTTMNLSAGAQHQIDARSSVSGQVGYDKLWLDEGGSGYDNATVGATYSRVISARTSAGLTLSAAQSRYETGVPKSTTLGASVNARHQLDQAWTLAWSIGLSQSRSPAFGPFPRVNQTGLIGSLSLCRALERSSLCLNGARSQQPSTLGQLRNSDQVGLSYGERLSARDRVDLYMSYSRSSTIGERIQAENDFSVASVGATVSRILTQRLDAFLFGRTSRSYGGYLSDEPSIAVGLGVRARLGDRR